MRLTYRMLLLLFIIISGLYTNLNAQSAQSRQRGQMIIGQVTDAGDKSAIEYAYVIVYKHHDSTQAGGAVTDEEGRFAVQKIVEGKYYLEVQFMGYESKTISEIEVNRQSGNVDIGVIALQKKIMESESIDVQAERSAFEYRIDKKVINVSQQQTAISGTAVDVLENVPSLTVDIDGNVSLRGSSSFMVLVDNRPSVLEANEILQQIPASTIENIEIITNPSARFDPDGTSGIININTKKHQFDGAYGVVNLNGGFNEKYGGDFLINYRKNSYNLFLGGDYNKRTSPGSGREEYRVFRNDTTTFVNSDTESRRGRERFGFRGGIDWEIQKSDRLSLGFRYGDRSSERSSDEEFDEWSDPGLIHNQYISEGISIRSGGHYSLNLDYVHRFAKKGHELSGSIYFSRRNGDEESKNELIAQDGTIASGQLSTEKGPSERITAKLEYVLPMNGDDRFEAGYQSRIGRSEDKTQMSEYEPSAGSYSSNPQFRHQIEYKRNIHSLYSLYAGQIGSFGFQGGLRTEYTDRNINFIDISDKFTIDRWDLFPTTHFSYNIAEGRQVMASYTRRIKRPRGWYLEPFLTWSDAYNVRKGNPDLKPEYIDSYEMGYQTYFGANLFSAEGYYRITHNKIERVRSVYETNITLHTTENVGADYMFGSELMLNMDAAKWWNINLMGNLYNYKVEGELNGSSFSRSSFNWNTRFNNTIRLGAGTRLQFNAAYNSSTISSQGSSEGYFTANFGLRQEFLNRSLTATLQIRDVFASAKYESISEGAGFYTYRNFTREAPVVMLNLSFRINNHRTEQERQRRERQPEMNDDEDF